MRIFWLRCLLIFCLPCFAAAAVKAASPPEYRTITLQSEVPIGDKDVDTIPVDFYAAQTPSGAAAAPAGGAPTIGFLPQLGGTARDSLMHRLAVYTTRHGINAAVVTLPYHGDRWSKAEGGAANAGVHFLSGDPVRSAQAFAQSASDVTTVVSWLVAQPSVDKTRIGVVGISLGAIVAHLAMGRDDRISAGVAFLGGGDILDLSRHSFFSQLVRFLHPAQRVPKDLDYTQVDRILRRVDPLTYANNNRPRHVLMVQGARDMVIPPRDATELWKALGRPPIRWIDANHGALNLAEADASRAALEYLQAVWAAPNPAAASAIPTPQLSVPTIKLGLVAQTRGRDSLGFTPALTYQAVSVGTWPSHLGIAHADLGITGRGPFIGVGVTLTPYIDLGLASRLTTRNAPPVPRPYLGLHITF